MLIIFEIWNMSSWKIYYFFQTYIDILQIRCDLVEMKKNI